MKNFSGKALRWQWHGGIVEVILDREPANEIGTVLLGELEEFVRAMKSFESDTAACIISSAKKRGFSAGADLRELYHGAIALPEKERNARVRDFVERSHAVANAIDAAPFVTIAATGALNQQRCVQAAFVVYVCGAGG